MSVDAAAKQVEQKLSLEDKAKTKKKAEAKAAKALKGELSPPPAYLADRLALYDRLKKASDERLAEKQANSVAIKVTLPDGKVVDGHSWKTTPYEVAAGISKGLADNAVVAKVNGEPWDLDRPLEADSSLELLKFDSEYGQHAFWHSSAHILGEALERCYGGSLCYGPPIQEGFYYDMYLEDHKVSDADFKALDDMIKKITKEKQPFERLEIAKEDLLEMFKYNEFKTRIITEKVKTPTTTVYRCGPLIDMCRGPHLRHTGKVKAMAVTKNSAAYWEGNAEAESLQRVYGISFPDTKQMKEWKHFQEEAAKRDHRKIGREQDLFFFHELSPGSCFFQPKGAHIYNKLMDFMREEYWKRGFQEVVTPNMFNAKLWMTSGHWEHYSDDMFQIDVEKEKFGLKPMNCPGHCVVFDHGVRSWKDLPLRLAEFGVLHRNELSGALTGLIRVRRFVQDDAHIFAMPEQVKSEMKGCLDFLTHVYDTLGYKLNLKLSTRPDKFLGEIPMWDAAEKALAEAMDEAELKWTLNPGDGAFYGPKIDISLTDALRRSHQCATIQLDFQLPERFNLSYVDDKGEKKRPVIIHRAILGSVERQMAVLTENFAGKWPFWLSPMQAMVVPVGPAYNDYAKDVQRRVRGAMFCCDVDVDDGNTMNKKVRNAQLAQYNFIFVVGEKEKSNDTVNVRTRDNKVHGERSVEAVIKRFKELAETRVLNSEEQWGSSEE